MRNRIVTIMVVLFLIAGCASPESSIDSTRTPVVLTDGRFDEWENAAVLISDPEDVTKAAAVDIGEVRFSGRPPMVAPGPSRFGGL